MSHYKADFALLCQLLHEQVFQTRREGKREKGKEGGREREVRLREKCQWPNYLSGLVLRVPPGRVFTPGGGMLAYGELGLGTYGEKEGRKKRERGVFGKNI